MFVGEILSSQDCVVQEEQDKHGGFMFFFNPLVNYGGTMIWSCFYYDPNLEILIEFTSGISLALISCKLCRLA